MIYSYSKNENRIYDFLKNENMLIPFDMERVTSSSVFCYVSKKLIRLHIYEALIYKMEFIVSDLYGAM